jgi:tripartite-type tricarboxylate transporter receptor subunit TctC
MLALPQAVKPMARRMKVTSSGSATSVVGKTVRALTGLLFLLASAGAAYALDYPTRPVRFIVSFAAGGPTDTIGRLLGRYLSQYFGQQFIIENRTGAGDGRSARRPDTAVVR